MMKNMPDDVLNVIKKLVPLSVVNEIDCFVFYDNHPIERNHCDITICTNHGEVKEYSQREEVSSVFLGSTYRALQIRILRNSKCQLFYFVRTDHEAVILTRTEDKKLKVHKRLPNLCYYDVEDAVCRGQACLKVVQMDDAVPCIFDDKFENFGDKAVVLSGIHVDDSIPILTELKRKLTEAKYSIHSNMKTHKELMDLRKLTTFAAYQKIHPNLDDSMINQNYREGCEALKLQSQNALVKFCNNKLVIILDVVNKFKETLTDVTVLLHFANKPSIVYTTKLFQHSTSGPFWHPSRTQELQPGVKTAITVVMEFTELQKRNTSRMEFSGVISYKRRERESLVPFDYVVISHLEMLGGKFDVLAREIDDDSMLPVLATTEKFDLLLRIIGYEDETAMPLPDLFCKYLEMEQVKNFENAVIFKKSPYHALNGVLVIFEDTLNSGSTFSVSVHVRSDIQILPLIHYIHEAIPLRIIVTSKNHRITAKVESLAIYNEEIAKREPPKLNYAGYATSILNQSAMVLEYLDSCLVKMNASKDADVRSKIGKEIDLFAEGMTAYKEFRTKLLNEALTGALCVKDSQVVPAKHSQSMSLDNQ